MSTLTISVASASSSTLSLTSSATSLTSSATTSSASSSSTAAANFTLPTAFDTSLGSNFTNSSCPTFFRSFLADQDFISCYPMSFFLQNSKSYVSLARDGMADVETLLANYSCAADVSKCTSLMGSLAEQLLEESNCYYDMEAQQPLVTEAYQDFVSYKLIRDATCMTTNMTTVVNASYCYTDALYDFEDSSDAYLYLLPLGLSYPNTSYPSCTQCTEALMSLFYEHTGNSTLAISYTYNSAAQQIDSNCSSSFVPASAKPLPSSTSSRSKSGAPSLPAITLPWVLIYLIGLIFVW